MSWIDVSVRGWRDFLGKATDLVEAIAFQQPYLCRGQGDRKWDLRPSLLRNFPRRVSQNKVVEFERAAIDSYIPEAQAFLPRHVLPKDNSDVLSWWTIMQHYQAPTRLLDWSASPYVAAYFAVTEALDKDGAVWFFDNKILSEEMGNIDPPEQLKQEKDLDKYFMKVGNRSRLHTVKQNAPTDRMIAQHTLFTVSERVTDDHAKVIDAAMVGSGRSNLRYGRLIIRAKDKPIFLLHLHTLSIRASRLFPGIDGIGKTIGELARLQKKP